MNKEEYNLDYKQAILTAFSKCKTLTQLKQIQAMVIRFGQSQTQFYAGKLIRFAADPLSDLYYARRIFESLKSPNVVVFAAVISAHASDRRHFRAAFELYRQMLRRGISRPNQFVYPHALKACAGVLEPRAFGSVHAQIVKSGFGLDPVVTAGLVALYIKASPPEIDSARKVFDEMPERNLVAWTAMVSGYFRTGNVNEAISFFERMPGGDRDRDVATWNAAIAGSAQHGLFVQAILLFGRMLKCSDFLEYKEQETGRVRIRVMANGVTVASVLSACGQSGGALRLGRRVHGYAYRIGLVPWDLFVSNALVDMYGKSGSLRDAKRVFDVMPREAFSCTSSWNSMINCYALHGRSTDAIRVFEEMVARKDETTPDEITFVGLLNACAHGGAVDEGLAYFNIMIERYEIRPKIEHYGCLVDLLSRAGRFEEVMDVVNWMHPKPDEIVWSALLNGCKIHHRFDLVELALRKLVEINPRNGWYVISLPVMYGDIKEWEEFRKRFRESGGEPFGKVPGCSWVEIGEKFWPFDSGDTSHPNVEEIHAALKSLKNTFKTSSGNNNYYEFMLLTASTYKTH